MEAVLDQIWFFIVKLIGLAAAGLDAIFTPLDFLGPAAAIGVIAALTTCLTKAISRLYNPRRLQELQAEFVHWYNLRQEAIRSEDREKGKLLAKNIDQAKLNQVYYNYFFEGLLKNIATTYLPILLMLAYVNEAYRPQALLQRFGRDYVLRLPDLHGNYLLLGAGLWFVLSLIVAYGLWFLGRWTCSRWCRPNHSASPPVTNDVPGT